MVSHVLISGEAGAGKGTYAEQFVRAGAPIVEVDCRVLPAELVEAALFGWVRSNCFSSKGATIRRGVFEEAGQGTVVFDELAAFPREVHPQIARTLATGRTRRIGSNTFEPCPARVVATTADPGALAPVLRELFVEHALPPLRERLPEVAPELPRTLIARLAALRLDLATVRHVAQAGDPDRAVTELELLAAIGESDDAAPRRVYADLLLAQGDARGELIHVQCELADRSDRSTQRLRAHEQRLLAVYGAAWLGPVLALPHVTSAVLRRGFVEIVRGTADVMRSLDVIARAAPALREVLADGVSCWRAASAGR